MPDDVTKSLLALWEEIHRLRRRVEDLESRELAHLPKMFGPNRYVSPRMRRKYRAGSSEFFLEIGAEEAGDIEAAFSYLLTKTCKEKKIDPSTVLELETRN